MRGFAQTVEYLSVSPRQRQAQDEHVPPVEHHIRRGAYSAKLAAHRLTTPSLNQEPSVQVVGVLMFRAACSAIPVA